MIQMLNDIILLPIVKGIVSESKNGWMNDDKLNERSI